MKNRLNEIFLELIKIEGISTKEKDVADYIINFLNNLGYVAKEDKCAEISGGNSGNIICEIGSGGDFILLSHMDTARSTKGVNPVFLSDRIKSDGNTVLGVDNRAGIASILYSLELVTKKNIAIKDFTIVFTIQEETTLNGSKKIELKKEIIKGFVFDSHLRPGHFIFKSAGSMGFSVEIYGKAAHSGIAPEKGIDAIKIASTAIHNIPLGRIDDDTTANIGIINGGKATNVIPDLVFLEGEVRSMNLEKIEQKIEEIESIIEKSVSLYGGKYKFEKSWSFYPYSVDTKSETYLTLIRTLEKVNLHPKPEMTKGGSDANSLNYKGITTINLGIGAENPHSNDEFILYEDLEKTAEIIMELIKL